MGLNSRDIRYSLCRVLNFSAMISSTFAKRHPLVFTSLVVLFILYIFLSYIFSFLVYISPVVVSTAIFVTIFWSSEQNQIINVKSVAKNEEKKESVDETNTPKVAAFGKSPSSRRRNFTSKKLDVYGDLEPKPKDLSEVFKNDFTSKSTLNLRGCRSFRKEEGSYLDYDFLREEKAESLTKQALLFSEPSILDLVDDGFAGGDGNKKETEEETAGEKGVKVETEAPLEGSQKFCETKSEEGSNKTGELVEDDQKNEMELGIAEAERTKRLESLIARRRLRRILKMQIEKGLVDIKSVIPGKVAPLSVTKVNTFDSSKGVEVIDGIDMPGSAPSVLRSPFDIPYDPFEEKPVLTGDGFEQEFAIIQQKDNVMFSRNGSFTYGFSSSLESRQNRLPYSRNRRHLGKASHAWFDQLISKQGIEREREPKAPNTLSEGQETIHEVDEKGDPDMEIIKEDEEAENAHATKSMPKPNHKNVERDIDSVYQSLPTLADKNQGNMFISHTPSCSLASDLHVEVSEAGSPTLTVDESHDAITSTDAESMIYDGDIDKDVTSGSEDMWGASLHTRESRRASEQDISEVRNWKDISSPSYLQNIDEENAADVSSMSSKSDMPEDTPNAVHAISSGHNIFSHVDYFMGRTNASHPSTSSKAPPHRRRLVDNNTRIDHVPDQTHSEKPEEWCNVSDNLISRTQDIDDVNNATTTEQGNTQNSKGDEHEDNDALVVRQETIDEVSIHSSSSSSSPRSVLPPNDMEEQASSSSYNQEMHVGVHQSNMENMAQATSNGEGPIDTMPQNIHQPLMDDPIGESHSTDLSHSQEQSYPQENSNQESIMSSMMNDAYKEKSMDVKNIEDKFSPLIRQDASAESSRMAEMKISEDMNEKSRELFHDKVPMNSLMVESSSEVCTENEDKSQASMREKDTMEPLINFEATGTNYSRDLKGNHNDLNMNEDTILSGSQLEKPTHKSEKVDFSQSEEKEVIEDHNMKHEKLDRGEIYEDSSAPMMTEVTNDEKKVRESDNMHKNDTIILSDSAGEGDNLSNNTHEKA